jgi:hypothetical protein
MCVPAQPVSVPVLGHPKNRWKQHGEGPSMAIEQWLTDVEIGS